MLKRFNYIFNKEQKRRLVIVAILIIIGTFTELVGVTAVLPFISVVMNDDMIEKNATLKYVYDLLGFNSHSSYLIFLALVIVAVYIGKNIFVYIMHTEQYRFTYDSQRVLSSQMLECYLNQSYLYHVNHNRAELMRNAGDDVRAFFEVVLAVLQLASEGSVMIVLLAFLLISDVMITISVVLLAAVFGLFYIKIIKKKLKKVGRESHDNQENTQRILLESLGSIKEVKVAARENYFLQKYDAEAKAFAENNRKFKQYGMLPKPVMETICISGLLLIIVIKLAMGVKPATFIPAMSVFAVATFRMLPSVNRIAEYMSRIFFSRPSVDAIYEDLQEIRSLQANLDYKIRNSQKLNFEKEIKVDGISFKYPAGDRNVLDKISMAIPKNASVALIGPSGQGKTTLADLLLGLLTPDEGHIYADGVDINTSIDSWQQLLGYIPQTISLLDASIKENILFGIPEEKCNEAILEKTLKEAQLYDLISSLPQGINTIIGEGGVRLSGGQRQRIGIARALYRQPEILILDEATSALDNDTEKAVMDAIDALSGTRTMIIIAHRLTTIKNCDLIYRVEGGRVELNTEKIDI